MFHYNGKAAYQNHFVHIVLSKEYGTNEATVFTIRKMHTISENESAVQIRASSISYSTTGLTQQ